MKRSQKKKDDKKLDVPSMSKSSVKIKELNVFESSTPTDILMLSSDLPIDALLTQDASLSHNWILDSGASFHVTPYREWFSTYMEGSLGIVRLGDAHAIAITGMGDICLLAFQNGT